MSGDNEQDREPTAWFENLTVSDGTRFEIPKSGLVLLVGPNNAGKSQALKDLQNIARQGATPGSNTRAITDATFQRNSDFDIQSWVTEMLPSVTINGSRHYQVPGWTRTSVENISANWGGSHLGVLTDLFVLYADGISRLTAGNSTPSIDLTVEPPNTPLQRIAYDTDLERELSNKCKEAFGTDAVADRHAGSIVCLRLGDPPTFDSDTVGRPTMSYLDALRELPKLEDQGDGVRSYVGLLLNILAGAHDILLIDEPEAFLHPPQARLLANVFSDQAMDRQVFLATHSSAIVQGALAHSNASTTIVRITREGNLNHASVLKDEDVKSLWSDPLLRYSNVLDGLFHDAVILCEGDSDCRYYQAVLENLVTSPTFESTSASSAAANDPVSARQGRTPQLLFTHCGGKQRLASVVESLKAVGVPAVVIADFDVLRDRQQLLTLVSQVQGNVDSSLTDDLTILDGALSSGVKELRKTPLKDALNAALDELGVETIDSKNAEKLRAIIRSESGWDRVKRSGLSAVPAGDAFQACERIIEALAAVGILVVPVGELEGFERSVGGHGRQWVTAVLEQNLHLSPGEDARSFISLIRFTSHKLINQR